MPFPDVIRNELNAFIHRRTLSKWSTTNLRRVNEYDILDDWIVLQNIHLRVLIPSSLRGHSTQIFVRTV